MSRKKKAKGKKRPEKKRGMWWLGVLACVLVTWAGAGAGAGCGKGVEYNEEGPCDCVSLERSSEVVGEAPSGAETSTGPDDAGGTDQAIQPEPKPEGAPPEKTPSEGSPPEGNPPEGNPPEGTPPEKTPSEGSPPEGNPPEGTPPEKTVEPTPEKAMPEPLPDGNKPFGLTQRVANTSCKLTGTAPSSQSMDIERVFTSLSFSRPVFLTHAGDGTDRLFVVEQAGNIKVFPNRANVASAKTFLALGSKVSRGGNEEGLLGLAFHPNYKQNGYFYVYYSAANPRRSVVSRFKVSSNDPDKADATSEQVITQEPQPYSNHNGGMMAFGPDGYLYISLGDGGSGGDPKNHGQNLSTRLGAILRIDVDKKDTGLQYAIPTDNPFVSRSGAKGEIWAYGLRNVWRFSFDRVTGELWAGDVGQSAYEEIDLIKKGGNYGWRLMEGFHCYNPSTNCPRNGLELPIVEHTRTDAKSITGGYVYRGKRLPELYGAYIYGDYVTGKIWALRYDGKKVIDHPLLVSSNQNVASFGEDQSGELYFTAFNGRIYRLKRKTAGGSGFPTTLSATKCFKSLNTKNLQPVDGVIPYDVNVRLWSDGLEKQRWLALQGTAQITYKANGSWDFPNGTVLIKHFSYEATKGDPNTRRHVETRFMVKGNGVWLGYSYVWNQDQTEATLLAGNANVSISQKDGNKTNQFTHVVPNRTECLQCHNSYTNYVLGLETRQLNGDFDYNGVVDNQLRAMNNIKLFVGGLPSAPAQLPKLPKIDDTSVPIQERARAYLHANCAFCHQPSGTRAKIDLRITTAFKDAKTCGVAPGLGDLNVTNPLIIAPKQPDRSILYLRMNTRATGAMPQIGTRVVHAQATKLIRDWILNLNSCPP